MRYAIDHYKTENLTPDEVNLLPRRSVGLWLFCGEVKASSSL